MDNLSPSQLNGQHEVLIDGDNPLFIRRTFVGCPPNSGVIHEQTRIIIPNFHGLSTSSAELSTIDESGVPEGQSPVRTRVFQVTAAGGREKARRILAKRHAERWRG